MSRHVHTLNEHRQAEELDAYLMALQSGRQPARPHAVPAGEAALLEGLVALAQAHPPDPDFAAGLQQRLRAVAQRRPSTRPAERRRERNSMSKRIVLPLAGAAALAVLFLVVLYVLRPLSGGPDQVAQLPTSAPPAVSGETIQPPTVTPSLVPQETPGSPASPSASPQETPAPPATPPVSQIELASLPPLSALVGGGYGGGGGAEIAPPQTEFVLNATLPESPAQMTFYVQGEQAPLTVEYVRQVAARLGLDTARHSERSEESPVYAPQPSDPALVPGDVPWLAAVDGPREVLVDRTGSFNYTDWGHSPWRSETGYPPQNLPPLDQALESAERFLETAGLLGFPYRTADPSGDVLRFFRVLDERWTLMDSFADVHVGSDGQVWSMAYRDLDLHSVGEYPIISAQEAWDMLRLSTSSSGDTSGRVWLRSRPALPAWGEFSAGTPRYWTRRYPAGQRADLFGSLRVLYPAELGDALYVTMNGLVLTGDPGDLQTLAQAYEALVHSSGDTETPVHVWGQVQDAGGYLTLEVEGWENGFTMDPMAGWQDASGAPYYWSGTIQRQGDQGLLLTDSGRAVQVPDLPADLADGTAVFVQGGLAGDNLEWHTIQEALVDEGPYDGAGVGQPVEVQAVVEQVELIYYIPPADSIPPDSTLEFAYRCAQPVWHFSGHTDQGRAFEVYVQAVADAYLKTASD